MEKGCSCLKVKNWLLNRHVPHKPKTNSKLRSRHCRWVQTSGSRRGTITASIAGTLRINARQMALRRPTPVVSLHSSLYLCQLVIWQLILVLARYALAHTRVIVVIPSVLVYSTAGDANPLLRMHGHMSSDNAGLWLCKTHNKCTLF